ncbi:MAG: hypothetical protein K2X34_09575 [Hyphomonadaceae bacterium]|nr:hypothetical protein [Hyphomonadaceae bacterium]
MPEAARLVRFISARPRLVRCAFAQRPVVGVANILQIKTRHAETASLVVRQDREELFNGDIPPNTEITLTPLTAAELVISLTLEARPDAGMRPVTHSLRVKPHAPPPAFAKIEVPAQVSVGERVTILWDAPDAVSITLQIENDGERSEHSGTSSGAFVLRPNREGLIVLRLVAQGPHAKTSETRFVRVKMPKPRIEIEQPVQSGAPGNEVAFHWKIAHAREAFLEVPLREQAHRVALEGGMVVTIDARPEEFHLVAVGLDGRRYTERLSTVPRLIASLDEP